MKAIDSGNPQLSSVIQVTIYIRHVTSPPPTVDIGFAEDWYSVQVNENSAANTLIKSFPIVNADKLSNGVPLQCTIIAGNPESEFLLLHINI